MCASSCITVYLLSVPPIASNLSIGTESSLPIKMEITPLGTLLETTLRFVAWLNTKSVALHGR